MCTSLIIHCPSIYIIYYLYVYVHPLPSIPLNCWRHPAKPCHSPSWEQWSCSWLWQFSNQMFPSFHLARKGSKCPTKSILKITMIIKMYCKSVLNINLSYLTEAIRMPTWSGCAPGNGSTIGSMAGLASSFMAKHKRKPESYFTI